VRKILLMSAVLLLATGARAATTYVSQSGGTVTCNAGSHSSVSVATFNTSTPAAGDHVYICGTLTTFLGVYGSGTSGNVITVTWDTGASISLPTCNGSGAKCVDLSNNSYIVLDGGTPCGPGTVCAASDSGTGIIEATASGSPPLANQPGPSEGIYSTGSHVEIKNLIIRNVYQHTSFMDNTGGAGDYSGAYIEGSGDSMHDCTVHDVSAAYEIPGGTNLSDISFYNNNLWNINWGFSSATGGSGSTQTSYSIHDNHFGTTANWDDSNDTYHHDQLFLYDSVAGEGSFNGVLIYNNLFDGAQGMYSTGMIYFGGGQQQNTYVYNNVFNNSGQSTGMGNALLELTGNDGTTTQTVWVYNNTILGAGPTIDTQDCVVLQGTFVFESNVVSGCATLEELQNGTGGAPTITGLDYNQYAFGTGSNIWKYGNTSTDCSTLTCWQSATSAEAHSAYYSSQSSLDISSTGVPLAGSPLINAGPNFTSTCSTATGLCSDTSYGGQIIPTARPSTGSWTIGAYNLDAGPVAPCAACMVLLPPTNLTARVLF